MFDKTGTLTQGKPVVRSVTLLHHLPPQPLPHPFPPAHLHNPPPPLPHLNHHNHQPPAASTAIASSLLAPATSSPHPNHHHAPAAQPPIAPIPAAAIFGSAPAHPTLPSRFPQHQQHQPPAGLPQASPTRSLPAPPGGWMQQQQDGASPGNNRGGGGAFTSAFASAAAATAVAGGDGGSDSGALPQQPLQQPPAQPSTGAWGMVRLMRMLLSVESQSEHPIARAVCEHAREVRLGLGLYTHA